MSEALLFSVAGVLAVGGLYALNEFSKTNPRAKKVRKQMKKRLKKMVKKAARKLLKKIFGRKPTCVICGKRTDLGNVGDEGDFHCLGCGEPVTEESNPNPPSYDDPIPLCVGCLRPVLGARDEHGNVICNECRALMRRENWNARLNAIEGIDQEWVERVENVRLNRLLHLP